MATQILATPAPVRYNLSPQERALIAPQTEGTVSRESMAVIEEQRRNFIKRNGWDGLHGTEPDSDNN